VSPRVAAAPGAGQATGSRFTSGTACSPSAYCNWNPKTLRSYAVNFDQYLAVRTGSHPIKNTTGVWDAVNGTYAVAAFLCATPMNAGPARFRVGHNGTKRTASAASNVVRLRFSGWVPVTPDHRRAVCRPSRLAALSQQRRDSAHCDGYQRRQRRGHRSVAPALVPVRHPAARRVVRPGINVLTVAIAGVAYVATVQVEYVVPLQLAFRGAAGVVQQWQSKAALQAAPSALAVVLQAQAPERRPVGPDDLLPGDVGQRVALRLTLRKPQQHRRLDVAPTYFFSTPRCAEDASSARLTSPLPSWRKPS